MRRLFPLGVLGLLAIICIALSTALRQPAPEHFDVGAPGDAYVLVNFYAPELNGATSYRWSGRGASLLLDGAFAGPRALAMRVQGNAYAPAGGQRLDIGYTGAALASTPVAPEWRTYRLLLPPAAMPASLGQQPLAFEVATYRPGPTDPRDLGVALDWLQVVPLGPAPGVGPLAPAALLTWLLALLGGGLWLSDRAVLRDAPRWRMVRVAGLLAAAGAGLVVWAYRWPTILAWALPLSPGGLALATLALAAGWLLADTVASREGRVSAAAGHDAAPSSPPGSTPPRWLLALSAPHRTALFLVAGLHILLLPFFPPDLRGAAAVVLLFMPGALAAWLIFADSCALVEQAFMMICGGAAVFALLLFGLQALPGPLPWWLLLGVVDAMVAAMVVRGGAQWGQGGGDRPPLPAMGPLLLVLLLAATLRLWGLGASEFQGDEARAVLLANGLANGYEGILLSHTKGPGEALFPAGPLVLTGQMPELAARLPFAIAGIGVVVGAYVLAMRLFGSEGRTAQAAGLVAAAVLASDGLLIGFGRIVQYQSIVMLSMAGALWCCWRFFAGVLLPGRYLACAAVLLAVGLLSHYDAAAVVPALAWLVLWGGRRRGWRGGATLRHLWLPLAIGVGLLGSFYLPFVLDERFARTAEYLAGRTREGEAVGLLYNNLPQYYKVLTFYNTTFQVYAAWVALLAGLALWLVNTGGTQNIAGTAQPVVGHAQRSVLASVLAVLLLVAAAISAWQPGWLQLQSGINIAIIGFGLPLAGLVLARHVAAGLRAALIWFALPFLAMSFVIAVPRTHFYTMHTAAALLVGLAIARLWYWRGVGQGRERRPWARRGIRLALACGGFALLLLALPYLDLVFLRLFPEYRRTFPAARPALYRSAYGDTLPEGGYFGFPRHDAWQVVAGLYAAGELAGSYDSNQNPYITGWYLRGAPVCKSMPDYYFVALTEPQQYIPLDYHQVGEVYLGPLRALDIYQRQAADGPVRRYELAPTDNAFVSEAVPDFPLSTALDELTPRRPLDIRWQAGARLRGYDLLGDTLIGAAPATMTLYWQAGRPLSRAVTPVLSLRDETGATVRELQPACADHPASLWTARYFSPVQFILAAEGLAPGLYSLHATLREGGVVLPLLDGAGDGLMGRFVVE